MYILLYTLLTFFFESLLLLLFNHSYHFSLVSSLSLYIYIYTHYCSLFSSLLLSLLSVLLFIIFLITITILYLSLKRVSPMISVLKQIANTNQLESPKKDPKHTTISIRRVDPYIIEVFLRFSECILILLIPMYT